MCVVGKSRDGVNVLRGKVELVEYLGREQEAAIALEGRRGLWVKTHREARAGRQHRHDFAGGQVRPAAARVRRQIMATSRTDTRSELDIVAILCLLPSVLYVLVMFVYPFLYGVYISLQPKKRAAWSIQELRLVLHRRLPIQYHQHDLHAGVAEQTVAVVIAALFLAYGMRRGIWFERTITTILVLPISLGVVFLSEGILGFYGPMAGSTRCCLRRHHPEPARADA